MKGAVAICSKGFRQECACWSWDRSWVGSQRFASWLVEILYHPAKWLMAAEVQFGSDFGLGPGSLLQGTFLIEGLNLHLLHLLHWQVDSLLLHHLGIPWTGVLGRLQSTELQRVGHNWVTEHTYTHWIPAKPFSLFRHSEKRNLVGCF